MIRRTAFRSHSPGRPVDAGRADRLSTGVRRERCGTARPDRGCVEDCPGRASRRAGGRLFLGRCLGRIRTRQRREERGRRLLRWRAPARRSLRRGQRWQPPAMKMRCSVHYNSRADQLRPIAASVLLGRTRSHRTQPAGSGQRHSIPLGDLLRQRRTEEDRHRLHRPANGSQVLLGTDRDPGRAAAGVLSRRGLPPALRQSAPG